MKPPQDHEQIVVNMLNYPSKSFAKNIIRHLLGNQCVRSERWSEEDFARRWAAIILFYVDVWNLDKKKIAELIDRSCWRK